MEGEQLREWAASAQAALPAGWRKRFKPHPDAGWSQTCWVIRSAAYRQVDKRKMKGHSTKRSFLGMGNDWRSLGAHKGSSQKSLWLGCPKSRQAKQSATAGLAVGEMSATGFPNASAKGNKRSV
eukprot:GGOE01012213.1.p5 GENE.GGOE01012213.1~~GGOE01012213.1.p5  ORF type:complete len:124 (-),score=3.17 GGOE01012213.1:581-952(-)